MLGFAQYLQFCMHLLKAASSENTKYIQRNYFRAIFSEDRQKIPFTYHHMVDGSV